MSRHFSTALCGHHMDSQLCSGTVWYSMVQYGHIMYICNMLYFITPPIIVIQLLDHAGLVI